MSTKGSTGFGSGGSAPGAGVVVVVAGGASLRGHGGTLVFRSDLERSELDEGALGGGAPPCFGSVEDPGLPVVGLLRDERDLELSEAG